MILARKKMEPLNFSGFEAELHFGNAVYPVAALTGKEEVNAPYWFSLKLTDQACLLEDNMLGEPCLLTIRFPPFSDTASSFWPKSRAFSAMITQRRLLPESTQAIKHLELKLEPRLATLKLSSKPRVYVRQTTREIAKKILTHHGYLPEALCFIKPWKEEEYTYPHWVQAQNETDFDFIQRLLAYEGLTYFWRSSTDEDEQLYFVDTPFMHPQHEASFFIADASGMCKTSLSALYKLQMSQDTATYELVYRDVDKRDPGRVIETRFGRGRFKKVVWGCGAQSLSHLRRQAQRHHEALMMQEVSFKAISFNPCLKAGFRIEIEQSPFWEDLKNFHILDITHHYQSGSYHNEISFIPAEKAVRPMPKRHACGQLVHTAVIHSEDELPYLDKNGRYTYYAHVHDEGVDKNLQQAMRLSPYGGNAVNQAMGMHFPLRRQAEVLVMYLHNDLNQPVLQNSPPNAMNPSPVTRDNSWCVLLKTAWGQYVKFSDKIQRESISLVSAHGRQSLLLKSDKNNHQIKLQAENGPIKLYAKETQKLATDCNISVHARGNARLTTEKEAQFKGQTLHLQAQKADIQAKKSMQIKADAHLEARANSIMLQSDKKISVSAEGELLQINLPNGDIVLKAKRLLVKSKGDISLCGGESLMKFHQSGITLQGQNVHFANPALACAVEEASAPKLTKPESSVAAKLGEVPYFEGEWAKIIHAPTWNQAIYGKEDLAFIEVSIEGFRGNEEGTISLLRYHHDKTLPLLPEHPGRHHLKKSEPAGCHRFNLGDRSLYVEAKAVTKTSKTVRLRIPIALTDILKVSKEKAHDPYYAMVEIEGIKSVYTHAMILLAQVQIEILHDKNRPYALKDAILNLQRALPDSVLTHRRCPLLNEARYYKTPTAFYDLPVGKRNLFSLKEDGVWRELLQKDYTAPQGLQTSTVCLDEANETAFIRLMPPIIFNLRKATLIDDKVVFESPTPDARLKLADEEVDYIKANGNNLTIFIHGYNVEQGEFAPHWQDVSVINNPQTVLPVSGFSYPIQPKTELKPKYDKTLATVFRDADFLKRQFPKLRQNALKDPLLAQEGRLNGTGVHAWLTHLEHHLNQAAGFDSKNYHLFSRCLFISWPGNPVSALDYTKAVQESIRLAPILARIILNLHQQIANLKLHIIAHSQGNGMLLHALNELGASHEELVNHAFFWQAAIPDDALSDHGFYDLNPAAQASLYQKQTQNPWFCPHAHRAAKRITVLYSQNDNILGRLLTAKEQPPGVALKEVWQRKDLLELSIALFLEALGLDNLYHVAVWVAIPVSELLNPETLNHAFEEWQKVHPVFYYNNVSFPTQATLPAQKAFLEQQHIKEFDIDFTQQLGEGLRKVHALLKERFAGLDKVEKALVFSSLTLTAAKAPAISKALLQILLKLMKKEQQQFLSENLFKKLLFTLVARFLSKHAALVQLLLTFMHTKLLSEGTAVKPAMGYEGPDRKNKKIKEMLAAGKLNPAETTKWIWQHSDMLESSESIMENVYKNWIINAKKGIQDFGHYKIQ